MATLSAELKAELDIYRQIADLFRENLSLEEMSEIENSINRLENLEVNIAVFGRTNSGKSSLLNSLLGYSNNDPKRPFISTARPNEWSEYNEEHNSVAWRNISGMSILVQDTPGIGGDYPEHREKAFRIAKNSDVIIFVTAEHIVGEEKKAMDELLSTKIPLVVAINQCDRLNEERRDAIKLDISEKWPDLTESIFLTAGNPDQDRQKTPIIDDLVNCICMIIQIRQHDLVWQTVAKHLNDKQDDARAIIHVAAGSAAGISAAIPTPGDAPLLTSIHVGMVYKLGKMFDKDFEKSSATAAYGVFVGAIGGGIVANFAMNFLPPLISNAARAAFTFAFTEKLGQYAFNKFKADYKPLPSLSN